MVSKSIKKAERSEYGEIVKIVVSLKRNTDFRGLEATEIEQKSQKSGPKSKNDKKTPKSRKIIDFGIPKGTQNAKKTLPERY